LIAAVSRNDLRAAMLIFNPSWIASDISLEMSCRKTGLMVCRSDQPRDFSYGSLATAHRAVDRHVFDRVLAFLRRLSALARSRDKARNTAASSPGCLMALLRQVAERFAKFFCQLKMLELGDRTCYFIHRILPAGSLLLNACSMKRSVEDCLFDRNPSRLSLPRSEICGRRISAFVDEELDHLRQIAFEL
jgi:hypothetical protein